MNLITNLTEKLKKVGYKLSESSQALLNKIHITGNNKIAKRIASLALCAGMAFGVATLSACSSCTPLNPSTGTEQGTPGDNLGNNPGDNPGGNTTDQDNKLSQYSQILQTVLTDEYYLNLANEYQSNNFPDSNKYISIPYAFLESKGHDISAIKADKLKCKSYAYIQNYDINTLYISVKAENKNSKGDYYTDYTISYKITEKEYNDLYMLHSGKYRQAAYFIQELSNVKTPTLISAENIDVNTYENFKILFNDNVKDMFNNKGVDFDLVNVADKNQISVIVRTHPSVSNMITENCIKRGIDISIWSSGKPSYDNNIFCMGNVTIGSILGDYNDTNSDLTYFSTDSIKNIYQNFRIPTKNL